MATEDTETKRWLIYLCSCKNDEPCIEWLYIRLRKLNIAVWFRREEIVVGDRIIERKEEGLRESLFVLAVISQEAKQSNWVKAELEPKILQQIDEQKTTVLPVTIDDTDPAEISTFLKGKEWMRIPCENSDEVFTKLLQSLEKHLVQRGLPELVASLHTSRPLPDVSYPYGLLNGVAPEYFIIPEMLLKDITEDLRKGLSVSLIGPPMIGKTSLLNFLFSERYREYLRSIGSLSAMKFLYIDLQEFVDKSKDDLLLALAQNITDIVDATKPTLTTTTHHKASLDWIKNVIGLRDSTNHFWVFLFDEIEYITNIKEMDKIFFDDLRTLSQRYNVCYVMASKQDLNKLPLSKQAKSSPFFKAFFKKHYMGVWDSSTAEALVFGSSKEGPNLFSHADFALMVRSTARHPLLLQAACEQLHKASQIDDRRMSSQLYRRYSESIENVYSCYWEQVLTREEQKWLLRCWQASSQTQEQARDELRALTIGEKNQEILDKLISLGLVMGSTLEMLKLPMGFEAFLRKRTIK